MTTLADFKGRIKQALQGYTRNQEQITWLAQATLATDTTMFVDPGTASALSRGLIEIEDELILLNTFNLQSGTFTVAAGTNGRGVENTTAAAHGLNSIITMDPDFPNQRITEAINDTIRAVYPDIYGMKSFEFNYAAARFEYPVPTDCDSVYKVTIETIGPSKVWKTGRRWRFNPQASTVASDGSPTGKSIQIMDPVIPGRIVRVMYKTSPQILVNNSDNYETLTGYDSRTTDMIIYGACWRLLSSLEPARLAQKSVESTERAPLVPAGAAANASTMYHNMFKERFDQEVDRLHNLFPAYSHFLA